MDCHTVVQTVQVEGEGVRVGDKNGRFWEADKVCYTTVVYNIQYGRFFLSKNFFIPNKKFSQTKKLWNFTRNEIINFFTDEKPAIHY